MDVLLTDGNERAALAAARSLIGAGWNVGVAAGRRPRLSLAGVSRGVRRLRLETDPLTDPAGYAAEVGWLAASVGARVVLPVTDASVEAILAGRSHLPRTAQLPFPELATYRTAADKGAVLDYAERAGLAVPDTVVLADGAVPLPGVEFFRNGAVLKPHRSVIGGRRFGVQFVKTRQQCRTLLDGFDDVAFPVLLQRRVRGAGEGLFMLRWNGSVVAEFAHRRLREKPPEGGVSVYRESIALDAELAAAGRRLLEALDWQGVAMIECKRDESSKRGRPVLMEINGRLWGSLQLAIDAGVDFPRLLVSCALGRQVRPVQQYRVGVRSRWFWGDVDNLYLQLRNGGGVRGKLAALRRFVATGFRRTREEIWRWRDPAPFLLESLQQLGLAR